jgi:hypothetical protein
MTVPATVTAARAAAAPYLLWVKLAAVLLMLGLVFGTGWKVCDWRWEAKESRELKALQDKLATAQAEWDAERQRWERASELTAANLSNLEAQKDTLLATLNGLKLTKTVLVKPNEQGECESVMLDDAFRLRWNGVVDQATAGPPTDRRD